MIDVPDAPWITDYDRYFNLFYQCGEEDDEDAKADMDQ